MKNMMRLKLLRGSRIYRSVGRVRFVKPSICQTLWSEILFQSYTKFYTSLGVDDFK